MGANRSDGDDPEAFVPSWDQDVADEAVGKTILVGMTNLEPDGRSVRSEILYHGVIVSVDPSVGVVVRCEGAYAGETICLPPDGKVFTRANPGIYTLHSTGEVVTNPDFATAWSLTPPVRH